MAGISVDRIVELNGLESADAIFVGATLILAEVTPPRTVHRVETGDTLGSIARTFEIDLAALASLNDIQDANHIVVGSEIAIPGSPAAPVASARAPEPPPPTPTAIVPTATPAPTVAPAPATPRPTATPLAEPSTSTSQAVSLATYVVQGGDTIHSIGRRFNVTPASIIAANHLASADHIFVGQRLMIPGSSIGPTVTTGSQTVAPTTTTASQPVAINDVVAVARQYLRAPYAFGGTTPAGFDCSGFIYFVFGRAGRTIDRDIQNQFDSGPNIAREHLQPGDLVFFRDTYMPGLSHNGIYAGNDEFINAVNEESGVSISRLSAPYWTERWYGATRPRR